LPGDTGFVLESVAVAELFLAGSSSADVAVGAGNVVDQPAFVVFEIVLPGA
jgi:hypothetical protein